MKGRLIIIVLLAASSLQAGVRPNSLFADNMVMQRGHAIPVWGMAREGETIAIDFAGQHVSTIARGGQWKASLKAMRASTVPLSMTITGDNTVTLTNIVIGDVWVASGQSNMERQLGPRVRQPMIENWEAEASAARYPEIREYYIPEHFAFAPESDADGRWTVCSPETVKDFSAVAYFFARDIYRAEGIPIGILFTAVGGTPAESWISAESLERMEEFKSAVKLMRQLGCDDISKQEFFRREMAQWYADHDLGSAPGADWQAPGLSRGHWEKTLLPNVLFKEFPGIIWLRKRFDLPDKLAGKAAVLHLGKIDNEDTAWVNGVEAGHTDDWRMDRRYSVPGAALKPGPNAIVLRILNENGAGGLGGEPPPFSLEFPGQEASAAFSLAGAWDFREGCSWEHAPPFPRQPDDDYIGVTVLYNAMIAPLLPFPIKGVIWYQGENNNERAAQYRELFPRLISDWRKGWGGGNFPFLFVQIAPYREMSPEIREAQFLTLRKSANTAMAVITDAGDADNIHPGRKKMPGERLALGARALAYGEKIEYSGPLFTSTKFAGQNAVITFTHLGGGLVAKGGELKGFTIAGAKHHFVPAHAEIRGKTVVVWSDQIPKPAAVRYGWANVPEVNLFNQAGLPASPFRTDAPL